MYEDNWQIQICFQLHRLTSRRGVCLFKYFLSWMHTVEQQIFACMEFSRILRVSADSRKFPARQYYLYAVGNISWGPLLFKKIAKIPCTRIACLPNSRKFPVLQYTNYFVVGKMDICITWFGIHIGDRKYLNEYTPFGSVSLWNLIKIWFQFCVNLTHF